MPKLVVAGIGNRLRGDDGFGPRVIDILEDAKIPSFAELRDYGTAGLTIASELDEYDGAIFIDAVDFGAPGELFVGTIDVAPTSEYEGGELAKVTLHEVGVEGLLKLARTLGTLPARVILVGCKPMTTETGITLSPPVEKATEEAAHRIIKILENWEWT